MRSDRNQLNADLDAPRILLAVSAPLGVAAIFRFLAPSQPMALAALVFYIAFLPLAYLLGRRSSLQVPQCQACSRRWILGTWLQSIGSYFIAIPCVIIGAYLAPLARADPALVPYLMLTKGAVLVGGLMTFLLGRPRIVIRIERTDTKRVWLKGIHEEAASAYCGANARS